MALARNAVSLRLVERVYCTACLAELFLPARGKPDNDAPGCLKAAGKCYPNYSFRLSNIKNHKLNSLGNANLNGMRVYVSYGLLFYMRVSDKNFGYIGENINVLQDTNSD